MNDERQEEMNIRTEVVGDECWWLLTRENEYGVWRHEEIIFEMNIENDKSNWMNGKEDVMDEHWKLELKCEMNYSYLGN